MCPDRQDGLTSLLCIYLSHAQRSMDYKMDILFGLRPSAAAACLASTASFEPLDSELCARRSRPLLVHARRRCQLLHRCLLQFLVLGLRHGKTRRSYGSMVRGGSRWRVPRTPLERSRIARPSLHDILASHFGG